MSFSSRPEAARTVLNATRARQGRFGRHMMWVLIVGTLLAALGLFATWTWNGVGADNNTSGRPTAPAPAFNAPNPANVTQQAGPAPESAGR